MRQKRAARRAVSSDIMANRNVAPTFRPAQYPRPEPPRPAAPQTAHEQLNALIQKQIEIYSINSLRKPQPTTSARPQLIVPPQARTMQRPATPNISSLPEHVRLTLEGGTSQDCLESRIARAVTEQLTRALQTHRQDQSEEPPRKTFKGRDSVEAANEASSSEAPADCAYCRKHITEVFDLKMMSKVFQQMCCKCCSDFIKLYCGSAVDRQRPISYSCAMKLGDCTFQDQHPRCPACLIRRVLEVARGLHWIVKRKLNEQIPQTHRVPIKDDLEVPRCKNPLASFYLQQHCDRRSRSPSPDRCLYICESSTDSCSSGPESPVPTASTHTPPATSTASSSTSILASALEAPLAPVFPPASMNAFGPAFKKVVRPSSTTHPQPAMVRYTQISFPQGYALRFPQLLRGSNPLLRPTSSATFEDCSAGIGAAQALAHPNFVSIPGTYPFAAAPAVFPATPAAVQAALGLMPVQSALASQPAALSLSAPNLPLTASPILGAAALGYIPGVSPLLHQSLPTSSVGAATSLQTALTTASQLLAKTPLSNVLALLSQTPPSTVSTPSYQTPVATVSAPPSQALLSSPSPLPPRTQVTTMSPLPSQAPLSTMSMSTLPSRTSLSTASPLSSQIPLSSVSPLSSQTVTPVRQTRGPPLAASPLLGAALGLNSGGLPRVRKSLSASSPGEAAPSLRAPLSTVAPLTSLNSLPTPSPLLTQTTLSAVSSLPPQTPLPAVPPLHSQTPLSTVAPLHSQAPLTTVSPLHSQALLSTVSPLHSQTPLSTVSPLLSQTPLSVIPKHSQTPLSAASSLPSQTGTPLRQIRRLTHKSPNVPVLGVAPGHIPDASALVCQSLPASIPEDAPPSLQTALPTKSPISSQIPLSTVSSLLSQGLSNVPSLPPQTPLVDASPLPPQTPLATVSPLQSETPVSSVSSLPPQTLSPVSPLKNQNKSQDLTCVSPLPSEMASASASTMSTETASALAGVLGLTTDNISLPSASAATPELEIALTFTSGPVSQSEPQSLISFDASSAAPAAPTMRSVQASPASLTPHSSTAALLGSLDLLVDVALDHRTAN